MKSKCKDCIHSQVKVSSVPGVLIYCFECTRHGYYSDSLAGLLEVHETETGQSDCYQLRLKKGRK